MAAIGDDWRVYYVNDGSRDRTLEMLLRHQETDPQVVTVDLSCNWGHQAAISAGLSEGDAVVLMDGDLQDPPEVIPDLVAAWRNRARVVVAQRRSRTERWSRGLLFPIFYRLLGSISDYPIPINAGIFGLMDREVVNAMNRLSETNRYLPGLRSWVGYPTAVVYYDRKDRAAGAPKQSLRKLLRYGLDAIFSFSYKPLRLSLFLGFLVAGLAFIYGIILVTCRFLNIGLFGKPIVIGYTSTIVSILFLGGVQLICAGILGEYLGRIYDEVKRRPLFLIQKIHPSKNSRHFGETR